MKLRANLLYKSKWLTPKTCHVSKTIELESHQFRHFSENLLVDHDFISGNQQHMSFSDGEYHCLLVLEKGGQDGILVNSEGHDYARYAAHVPNARGLMTLEQAPITEPEMDIEPEMA